MANCLRTQECCMRWSSRNPCLVLMGLNPAPWLEAGGVHLPVWQVLRSMPMKFLRRHCGSILVGIWANTLDCQRCSRCGGFPFRGDSFAHSGLQSVCERWGLSESHARFLFYGYIFLVHKSVAPANGRLADVAPGWLATCAWSPVTHCPLNHLYAAGARRPPPRGRQRSLQHGGHGLRFPPACHM